MEQKTSSNTPKVVGGVVAVGLVVAAIAWMSNTKNNGVTTTSPTPNQNNAAQPAVAQKNQYTDGSYTANGSYTSPAGQEEVEVTLVLQNDVIQDAQFNGKAVNPGSVRMQEQFSQGYKEIVVGKSISDLSLTVVNGASLTPKGFMQAVEKIKAQATQA